MYIKEHTCMREKMFSLRNRLEHNKKEIKIENGKLLIDGIVVDKNLFLSRCK